MVPQNNLKRLLAYELVRTGQFGRGLVFLQKGSLWRFPMEPLYAIIPGRLGKRIGDSQPWIAPFLERS